MVIMDVQERPYENLGEPWALSHQKSSARQPTRRGIHSVEKGHSLTGFLPGDEVKIGGTSSASSASARMAFKYPITLERSSY